jgi:hypothetical protein
MLAAFKFVCFFLILGLFVLHKALGQYSFTNGDEVCRISGSYSQVLLNGTPGTTNNFHFVALTKADGWSISATNFNNGKDWGLMRYDGTSIYMTGTFVGNSPVDHVNAFGVYGYVYPGQFYVPQIQDSVHLFLPWIAFHLSPAMLEDSYEHNGVIEMPWPWGNSRFSLTGYGYKWIVKSSGNDQIIRQIDVIRDSALDLKTEEDELRRSILDYQFSISSREATLKWLSYRKSVPNDFLRCRYECTEIIETNGLSIPALVKFVMNYPNLRYGGVTVDCVYSLRVDQIEFVSNLDLLGAIAPAKTFVSDYRFQATNNHTKFNYATYTLSAGDKFRSDKDPELLAQAKDWLNNGPKYSSYKYKRKIILAGMFIITLIFIGLLTFRLRPAR